MHENPDTTYALATARQRELAARCAQIREARRAGPTPRQPWRWKRRHTPTTPTVVGTSAMLAR